MLELKNICKLYGKKEVLHNFSVKFEKGIYGLLGPNGAGKSTMMNIAADVLKPSSGEVLYEGKSIYELKEEYRAHIGYLPQHVGYYSNFTAYTTLEYFANLRGVQKEDYAKRIGEVLEAVNLSENAKQKVKTFSGGMKQRLNFRDIMMNLAKDKTIILSTHIVSDVEDMADYLIFLKKGEIVCMDRAENIMEKAPVEEVYMGYFGEGAV